MPAVDPMQYGRGDTDREQRRDGPGDEIEDEPAAPDRHRPPPTRGRGSDQDPQEPCGGQPGPKRGRKIGHRSPLKA